MSEFTIIQGGMGVGVSDWRLARAVSRRGQLGVVSGTGLAVVLARRLQLGDPGGEMRRAISRFPIQDMATRVIERHFIEGGKPADEPFQVTPLPDVREKASLTELTVIANFVEVYLAKEGHDGFVGINFLEKIQLPTLASLFGAMLAGVDYVLIGAGIPRSIPGAIDALAAGKAFELKLDVEGAVPGETYSVRFDPAAFFSGATPQLIRPAFFPIVSSATLAMTLARKSNGRVDGFVVEGFTAGGHNAPPRGPMQLSESGEPIYGPRDHAELDKIAAIGLPFYLAGGYATHEMLSRALELGASGVQVGTAFAFCDESGILPDLKRQVICQSCQNQTRVFTDPVASPTGFPFKILEVPGTLSDKNVIATRQQACDLGYLRQAYRRPDATIGFRCPAESPDVFVRKAGAATETIGRKCICNALFATIGLGQVHRDGTHEPPILTAGDDVAGISRYLSPGASTYSAGDVIDVMLGNRN